MIRKVVVAVVGLAGVLSHVPCVARPGAAIALVGAGNGAAEVEAIRSRVLTPRGLAYTVSDEWLDPAGYAAYSLVVLCPLEHKLTAGESAAIERYLQDGGHLILIAGAAYRLAGNSVAMDNLPWLGAKTYQYAPQPTTALPILQAADPVLSGVDPGRAWPWLQPFHTTMGPLTGNAVGLVGNAEAQSYLVLRNRVGQGQVTWFARELFRMREVEAEGWTRLLANAVMQAAPATAGEEMAAAARSRFSTQRLVFWDRAGLPPIESRLIPEPGELLELLTIPLGLNEYESFGIYATAGRDLGKVTASLSGVTFAAPPVIRYRSSLNRLLPFPDAGREVKTGEALHLWVTLQTKGLKAGEHRLALTLTAGERVFRFPITLRVYPVALPPTIAFHGQTYAGSLGAFFEVKQPGDAAVMQKYRVLGKDLWEHRSDVLDCFGFGASYPALVRVKATGKTLAETLAAGTTFSPDNLPDLDLSVYDPYAAVLFEAGRWEHVTVHLGDMAGFVAKMPAVTGRQLTLGDAADDRVAAWYLRQWTDFFKRHGAKTVWAKVSDEFGAEYVDEYLKGARLCCAAGMRPYSTVTGLIPREPQTLLTLAPEWDQWQLGTSSMDYFAASLKQRPDIMHPGAVVSFYGGGTQPWLRSYESSRSRGFLGGYHNYWGHGFWVYMWWAPNEQSAFYENGEVVPTPVWEGFRDGQEDAEYYVMLNRQQGGPDFGHGLVGTGDDAILKLEPQLLDYTTIQYAYHDFGKLSAAQLRRAKARLLELLTAQPR